tara:strand:- start:34 stop:195 length:162 start_codon:yes stop_codon:yes gene_type:complete
MISFLVKQGGLPYCYTTIIVPLSNYSTPLLTIFYDKQHLETNKRRLDMGLVLF